MWHIDPNKEYFLFSDSSDTASGSVLFQINEEKLRPVAFHSEVFTLMQWNYFASEREMLGIIHALKKYYTILVGGPVINVYTDHKSLCALIFSKSPTTP